MSFFFFWLKILLLHFFCFLAALRRLGVKGMEIRKPEQLQSISSLIIPGGESTTMAKLAEFHNLVFSLFHHFILFSLWPEAIIYGLTIAIIQVYEIKFWFILINGFFLYSHISSFKKHGIPKKPFACYVITCLLLVFKAKANVKM